MTNHEEFRAAEADRAPTPEEELAAEDAQRDVDLDSVAEEYDHMTELGANVRGEGQIDSDHA